MSLYGSHFYYGLIRKYVTVMGSLLDGIDVVRYNPNGTEKMRTRVPLNYVKKEKWVQRLLNEPNDLDRKTAITLPRIAFEMTGMDYDASRKLSSKHYFAFVNGDSTDTKLKVMMPVPWTFSFSVYITAKTQEDALQIVEQIVPFFTPDYTVTMKGLKNPNMSWDTPVSLQSVNTSDSAEGGFEERRIIFWELQFKLRGYLFSPIKERGIIKTVNVKIMDYDEIVKAPQLRNFIVDIDIVPFIDGVPLEDIGPDDPWTLDVDIEYQQ